MATMPNRKNSPIPVVANLAQLLCFGLLVGSHVGPAHAFHHATSVLGAIDTAQLGCGCRISLPSFATPCLFSTLDVDAPLLIALSGKERWLNHLLHEGISHKGDSLAYFSDVYADAEYSIRIGYSPAASTCPKNEEDGCEYADMDVAVLVHSLDEQGTTYEMKGVATCGC